ncbi:MAG: phospholipase D family protein [Epsilonproteobacteria bacterium]|nr:MAG: phospholipase D family protein [Campylobacterota bacterium]
MYLIKIFITVSVVFFLSACSHKIPESSVHKNVSFTKLPNGKAPLLAHLKNTDKPLGNKSAFYSLASPVDAFAARLFLIDNATTSLDVQYYIYKKDKLGNVFTSHILMAAQRGVKVRMLMDDLSTSGKDKQWQKLASHPNIELRLFNPNIFRSSFRNLALLFNLNTLGKRMHNKSLIADGSAAIIGGRNIGNDYFASSTKKLFLDYDVLAVGNVVPDIYKAFDLFWNSEESVPSEEILGEVQKESYKILEKKFMKVNQIYHESLAGKAVHDSDFNQRITEKNLELTVADKTEFYHDHPSKVQTDTRDSSLHISSQISDELKYVNENLLIISPYFIPSKVLMEKLKTEREEGVEVTIITNSLASTDVFPVYSGYQYYIKPLVEMGVKLYELKPDSFKGLLSRKEWANPNLLSLHTKMIIFDNDRLGVGSANIDLRSDKLNTEIFMIITSKKLVKEERNVLREVINLENFYKLSWGEHPDRFDEDFPSYGPIWTTLEGGREKIYYDSPHVGFWRKLGTAVLSLLPIEGQL